jgi:hypothetical protein
LNLEESYEIISILGRDKIEELYCIAGGRKVSFATLKKIILHQEIINEINTGRPFNLIADKCKVSKMTVYRIFSEVRKKSNRN